MKYSSKAAALVLGLLLPFAASRAQTASKEEPSKWSFSLGADPTAFDLRTRDPGVEARLVANLARTWQAPESRFTRHISLMVGADAQRYLSSQSENCDACSTNLSNSYAALTGGGSADLFRLSRFTPYVLGGVGFYYSRSSSEPANGVVLTSNLSSIYTRHDFTLGLNTGLGIKARLGSHEFFVEQLLHAFDIQHLGRGINPLNFGIKF